MIFLDPVMSLIMSLMFLLVAKCCFNRTFVIDKKAAFILFVIFLLQELNAITGKGIPWFDTLAVSMDFIWMILIVLRGGKGRIKRALSMLEVFATLGMGLVGLCGFIITIIMPALSETVSSEYACVLGTIFSSLITVYVYFNLYKKGIFICFKTGERVMLIFFDLYIFILFSLSLVEALDTGNIYMESWIKYVFVITMGIFYLVFLGVLLKGRITDYYQKGQVYQQEWMERELRYFTEYKKAEEETKRLRHDMINNLICVETMMQAGKTEEARQYIETLLGAVKDLSPKVVTGDEMLDCIICAKWDVMQESGITFTVDGVLDRELAWQPIDICTVFANALDNAIEACLQTNERRISLLCKHTRNFYYIELQNTMSGNIDIRTLENAGYTTKKHKGMHGYGLDNMRRTLKRYDSEMRIEHEDGMFVLKMTIPG